MPLQKKTLYGYSLYSSIWLPCIYFRASDP